MADVERHAGTVPMRGAAVVLADGGYARRSDSDVATVYDTDPVGEDSVRLDAIDGDDTRLPVRLGETEVLRDGVDSNCAGFWT